MQFSLQNRTDALQNEILELEQTRIPARDAVNASRFEIRDIMRTRTYTQAHLRKVTHKTYRMEVAIARVTRHHLEQQNKREQQLRTVRELLGVIEAHLASSVNRPLQSVAQPVLT